MTHRVLVCGDRNYTDHNIIASILTGLYSMHEIGFGSLYLDPFTIIEGGCPTGADLFARQWFENGGVHPGTTDDPDVCSVEHESYPVRHKLDGGWPGAGPRRNLRMLQDSKPTLVLAFKEDFNWKLDKGGTENMVKLARRAGVRTRVIQ